MTKTSTTTSKKELRTFGLIMAGMIALFFGALLPWIWNWQWSLWPWVTAAVFLLLAGAAPGILKPFYIVWMKVGHVLGWINTRIILSIFFYGVLLPVGLLMRSFRGDPMERSLDKQAQTYRIPSQAKPAEDLEKPF